MKRFWPSIALAAFGLAVAGAFGLAKALGWGAHTAFIAGNAASPDTVALGLAYVVLWFVFLGVTPICLMGAAVMVAWERLAPVEPRTSRSD